MSLVTPLAKEFNIRLALANLEHKMAGLAYDYATTSMTLLGPCVRRTKSMQFEYGGFGESSTANWTPI